MPGGSKRRKVAIPVRDYPDMNFLGLIIGPRGETQRALELETGARIMLFVLSICPAFSNFFPAAEVAVLANQETTMRMRRCM